jgi:hypothetical protein
MTRRHIRLTELPGSKVVPQSDIPVAGSPPLGSMTRSGCCRTSLIGTTTVKARPAALRAPRTVRTTQRMRLDANKILAVGRCGWPWQMSDKPQQPNRAAGSTWPAAVADGSPLPTQARMMLITGEDADWQAARAVLAQGVELIRSPPPSIRWCGRPRAVPGTRALGRLGGAGVHAQDLRSGRGSGEREHPCRRLRRTFPGISGSRPRAGLPRKQAGQLSIRCELCLPMATRPCPVAADTSCADPSWCPSGIRECAARV